jgi:hypothetical protein
MPGPPGHVAIAEQFGLRGGTHGLPDSIVRCNLPHPAWTGIANEARRVMNERLKEKKLAWPRPPSSRQKRNLTIIACDRPLDLDIG